jgi:succinate-semialdehyde dehydrogenase/glutarate-semialdehyde dehydrogenase
MSSTTITKQGTASGASVYADARLGLFIDGVWRGASGSRSLDILNPATEEIIGSLPVAEAADIDEAIVAAERAFPLWRDTPIDKRTEILARTVELIRERADVIGALMTIEEGKPFAEARGEVIRVAKALEWDIQDARRAYGRIIPTDHDTVLTVHHEPVGPVAAFTPWNFPAGSPMRKMAGSIAAGCSIVLKASEETPATACALVECFADAGLPAGVVNLLFGVPSEISERLIPADAIRLVAFTGSIPVGKQLAALAGAQMKPSLMELGGHAPVIVCADADPIKAARKSAGAKYANAGQVCTSPSRFIVHESIYDAFVAEFVKASAAVSVGNGMDEGVTMGPLANDRRLAAIESLVADAVAKGATVALGGKRIGDRGYFYEPTVLTGVSMDAAIMRDEPFGPVSPIVSFTDLDDALRIANSLPYGLAAYGFTESASTADILARGLEAGILSINHCGGSVPEAPSGGVKSSGYGREGGTEGLEAYLITKRVSHLLRS